MRKIALLLCTVLCLGLFTALPASAALSANPEAFADGEDTLLLNENAADILVNGGIEFGSDFSQTEWGITGAETIGGVRQNFFGGVNVKRVLGGNASTYAVQLTNTLGTTSKTALMQTISVTPNVTYELSAWVKTLNASSGYAYLNGMFLDASGSNTPFSRIGQTYQNPTAQTPVTLPANTWVRKCLRFTAPEGAVKLTLYLYLEGIGNILFDDVLVLAPKEAIPAPVVSPKKEPVLKESSTTFGPVYAIDPSIGNFERYSNGYFIGISENPVSAHNAMVSTAYNHTPGGTKSLWLKNKINNEQDFQPNLYYNTVYLIPGATYQISTWILAPEAGTSADFSYWIDLTMSDGNTDQKKVHYTVRNFGWWREYTFDFTVPVDSAPVATSVQLRLMNDTQQYYIDDISLYMIETPPYADIVTDEMFYYTEWETGICSASPFSTYENALVGGRVEYAFLDQDGETVLDSAEVPYVDGQANYEFLVSLMAEIGKEYFVSAKVYLPDNTLVQDEIRSVYRFDRPTYLDADGVFRKKGKEYNLIAGSGVTPALLEKDPSKGGVQIIRLNNAGANLLGTMDRAYEMGMLCIIGLYGSANGGAESMIQNTINTVNTVKEHPALFGYQVQDEPYQKGNSEEDLARAYRTIRTLDPDHVVYLVDSVPGGFDYLFRYSDFVDIDTYSGAGADSGRVFTKVLEVAREASKGRKPFALMQQAFQYEGYRPTLDEMRNFSYQAFFAGAQGIAYHSLGVDGSDGITTPFLDMDDWTEICERWAPWEQGFLLDCFVNQKYPLLKSYQDDNVMWRTYYVDGKVYVITFNRQKNAASTATIPLVAADGTPIIGSFVATRKAGTKDTTAPSISGSGTLKLTLGGIVGREKGMTLKSLGGLAAEIWEVAPTNNLLPNGNFEMDFADGLPTESWVDNMHHGSGGAVVVGTATKVTADNGVQPATDKSKGFLKLHRTNENKSDLVDGLVTRIYYPLSTANLETGKYYRMEFYVNVPTTTLGVGVHFQESNAANQDTIKLGVGFTGLKSTNGWEKRSYDFKYDGGNYDLNIKIRGEGEAVAYIDELKLTEINASEAVLPLMTADGSFSSVTLDNVTPFISNTRATAGTDYDIVEDPAGSNNKVFKVTAANIREVLKFPVATGLYTADDVFALRFRVYLEVPESDPYESPQSLFVRHYTYNASGVLDMVRCAVPFPADSVNKWIDVDILTNAFLRADEYVVFEELTGYNYYVDDMSVLLCVGSYISDLKATGSGTGCKNITGEAATWMAMYYGTRAATVSNPTSLMPVFRFAPETAGEKAFAVATAYKEEDGAQMSVAIKVEALSRLGAENVTVSSGELNKTEVGLPSNNFALDFDLPDGTYRVKYFLWNSQGLSPIVDEVSFDVTVSSAQS